MAAINDKTNLIDIYPLRIALVDDQPDFCDYVENMLNGDLQFDVISKAFSAEQALKDFSGLKIDAAIIDVMMPNMDGFSLTKALLKNMPHMSIILTSSSDNSYYTKLTEQAGAKAFVPKRQLSKERILNVLLQR